MKVIEIEEIFKGKTGEVLVRGWLHHKRSSGGILFIFIRDGSGIIQCTLRRDEIGEKLFDQIERLPVESVIELKGTARKDERAPGGYEIAAKEVKVLQKAEEGFPIAKKYHGPDFLLNYRHLWLRSEKMQRIL